MKDSVILAIDTSCDETSAAVSCGRLILSNVIASQINLHKKYGGVVPHLAKRAHQEKIQPVVVKALRNARKFGTLRESSELMDSIDTIAVTIGPGLAPALEVGIAYAKKLAQKHRLPLIPVNHMEGHLLSSLALNSKGHGMVPNLRRSAVHDEVRTKDGSEPKDFGNQTLMEIFPALGLLVSGGHTQLVKITRNGSYRLLGETLDDAAGEALDKLAKMLKLGYPGGPIIEELAKQGDPDAFDLPIPMQYSKTLDMSFSGLKTAAMYQIQSLTKESPLLRKQTCDFAASFQKAVATALTIKLARAIKTHQPKSILLGGGVISNIYIRRRIRQAVRPFKIPVYLPYSKKLLTDNAAMIAIPAYYQFNKGDSFVKDFNSLERQPNLSF